MTQSLKEVMREAETWPPEVQEELVSLARQMGDSLKEGVYHLSPEELAGIERGLKASREGRFATQEQIDAVFAKYQQRDEDMADHDARRAS